jgi:phosphatidylglycerophosphatase A
MIDNRLPQGIIGKGDMDYFMLDFRTAKIIATFAGLGLSRFCPGTLGSVATLPLWFLIMSLVKYLGFKRPALVILLIIVGLFFLALEAVGVYIDKDKSKDDPREVVVDEVIGQLLSFFLSLFVVLWLGNHGLDFLWEHHGYLLMTFNFVTPVVFFRLYDIWKPGIIGVIDRRMKSALGIILDDVVAGLFAGLTNLLLFRVLWLFFL